MWDRAVGSQQVAESNVIKRARMATLIRLPGAADAATPSMIAVAVAGAAFGNGHRALERIDNVGGADVLAVAR